MVRHVDHRGLEAVLKRKDQFEQQISNKWQSKELTALLSPVFPLCALKREHSSSVDQFLEYTAIWNLLGYPCGVMPVTKVTTSEQFFRDHFNDTLTRVLDSSAADSEGLPVGVQLIGHSYEDERVMAVLKLLESELRIAVKPPRLSEESIGHYIRKGSRPTNYGSVAVELTSQ
jgi:fatty acid amide hydrolase